MKSVSKLEKRVHWTRFQSLETEYNKLGFKALKTSSVNSFFKLRNRVLWTRFLCVTHCQLQFHQFPVSPLPSHSSNITWASQFPRSSFSPQPSTCLWVPAGPVPLAVGSHKFSVLWICLPYHTFSSTFSSTLSLYIQLFSSNPYTHRTLITQHSQVIFLQYCDYLLDFF